MMTTIGVNNALGRFATKRLIAALMMGAALALAAEPARGDSSSDLNLSPGSTPTLLFTSADLGFANLMTDEQLTNFLDVLAVTPTVPYAALLTNSLGLQAGGTFFSLQHLGEWPPMPCDPTHSAVWQMSNCFLVDDLGFKYDAIGKSKTRQSSGLTVTADAVTGPPGFNDTNSTSTNFEASDVSFLNFIPYGTNLYLCQGVVSGGYLNAVASNTIADVYYELQSCTNLLQPNWQSLGFFSGSELTNWTAWSIFQGQQTNYFIRIRSWIDSYDIGIPDWWQIFYFGTNGINPAASVAGDGYSSLQKFEMGLNPTNYYNPNGPPGFFGYLDATGTNVFIGWSPAPGPVLNYSIQRGISNSLSGLYTYSQIGTVSSNASFIEDVGAINNSNATNDIYQLEAAYPGDSLSGTNTWIVNWYGQYGTSGAPYGPPFVTNFYAYVDTNAANVLLTWSPASSVATNYLIERGIYNASSETYVYHKIASLNPATNSFKVTAPFTNANNWSDNYAIIPVYPGGVGAVMAVSPVNVGWTNGVAGPTSFYGYADGTGTNLVLAWTPAAGTPTNYVIFEGNTNSLGAFVYSKLAIVKGGTNTLTVTNGYNNLYEGYAVFAVYTNGSQSQAAFWQSANGTPAPGNFVAYFDTTGASVWLSWTAPTGAITGYLVTRFDWNGEYFQATVGSTTTSYKDTNAVHTSSFDTNYTQYTVQATYPKGGVSSTAVASVGPLPTPASLSATLDTTGKNVVVTWAAVPGAVDYVIDRGVLSPTTGKYSYSTIATVGSGVTSYVDTGAIAGVNSYNNLYEVMAVFPGGVDSGLTASSISESSDIPLDNVYVSANLIRNGTGRWQVMFSGLPTNSPQTIQLTFTDDFDDVVQTNLCTTNLPGGIFQLPDAFALDLTSYDLIFTLTVQLFGPNGEPGQIAQAGYFGADAPYFVDGRQHLKQNLKFLLRAAPMNQLFFSITNAADALPDYDTFVGQYNETSTNFEEFSFLHHSQQTVEDLDFFQLDNLWPFTANYELANYFVDTSRTYYEPTVGIAEVYGTNSFDFSPNFATNIPAPPVLTHADPYWILQPGFAWADGSPASDWAINLNAGDTSASLSSGSQNLFGLAFNSGCIIGEYNDFIYDTLALNSEVTVPTDYQIVAYASWCPAPTLSLVNYYFAPMLPAENGITGASGVELPGEIDPDGGSNVQPFPVPIEDDFNVTNQTTTMIASVGQSMIIGGWAKYSVGSSGKFAYLGQYFVTNAFLLNSNGMATTNTAGVLSPYGEFLPLQAGVAQVTTMSDIDAPYQQGTNFLRIISMNVDANHDGTMDLTYAGPDQTSASRPFRFWANDDQDSGDFGGNFGIPGQGAQGDGSRWAGSYGYINPINGYGSWEHNYHVNGRRDLVDWFPVYLNINSLFQSNSLSAGINYNDPTYQFVLSQADGVLRFLTTDLTPTNYMNYLLDTNESGTLATWGVAFPVMPTGVALPSYFIGNIATNNGGILLVEAATNTTQSLVLTIYHGTNQIAQTQLYLSISGVEQMFRNKNLMLDSNDIAPADRLTDASVPNEPDTIDKNFVFLHGYNVNTNEARGVAADMFKRMYWSGSHAKFWAVTWEGAESKGTPPFYNALTPNYHTNVANAFATASNLANFVASLTNSGPVVAAAHSLGNMVVLSAISDWNAPISQYFMMDSAVPIEAIDSSATTNFMIYSTGLNDWPPYTNRLYASDWYKLFPSTDARSTLFWNNRLGNLGDVDVYNFYSSGEEVLRTYTNDPPSSVLGKVLTQVTDFWPFGIPFGTYTWYWQEKGKGTCSQDWFLGSSHGGWQMNYNPPYLYSSNGLPAFTSPAQALAIPNSQLMTNAFFNLSSTNWGTADLALYGPSGSAYAAANRNRILSDAIPALSEVAGANPVPSFDNNHNLNMNTPQFQNGWSIGRTGGEVGKWHHSDFVQMAYTFTYKLFNQFVTTGNLK
jgi:hypothetical protein